MHRDRRAGLAAGESHFREHDQPDLAVARGVADDGTDDDGGRDAGSHGDRRCHDACAGDADGGRHRDRLCFTHGAPGRSVSIAGTGLPRHLA